MLTSGKAACTPQARAKCDEDETLTAWSELCTKGKPCTALPEGKFSTQNTTLAAAAQPTKAAETPGQRLAVRAMGEICNIAGL